MGDLDYNELAKSLFASEVDAAIDTEDPYLDFMAIPGSVNKVAMAGAIQDPSSKNMKDLAIISAVSGLLEGVLGGASKRYQTGQQRLSTQGLVTGNKPEGIDDSIWEVVQRKRFASQLAQAADRKKREADFDFFKKEKQYELGGDIGLENLRQKGDIAKQADDLKNSLIKEYAQTYSKTGRKRILDVLQGLEDEGSPSSIPVLAEDLEIESKPSLLTTTAPTSIEEKLAKEQSDLANTLMEHGAPPGTAHEKASQILAGKRKELEGSYEKVTKAGADGARLLQNADKMRRALRGAGSTGFAGNIRQFGAGALGFLGVDEQEERYSSGQVLESTAADVIGEAGQVFKGPMSDRDIKIILGSGPSLDREESANEEILGNWEFTGRLQTEYAKFMRQKRREGIPVSDAEEQWSAIRETQPYVSLNPKTGKYEQNPYWQARTIGATEEAPTESILEGDPGAWNTLIDVIQSTPGEALGGVGDAVEGLYNLSKGETWKAMAAPEPLFDIAGTIAAGVAGGAKGAATGTAVLPGWGTAVGGVLGTGAGIWGYNQVKDSAKYLAGDEAPELFTAPGEAIKKLPRTVGQVTGGALIGKLAGVGIKGTYKLAKGSTKVAGKIAKVAQEKIIGVTQPKILDSALKKGLTYYDEAGDMLAYTDDLAGAKTLNTSVETATNTLRSDGYFKIVTNDPTKNQILFAERLQKAGAAVGKAHKKVAKAINTAWKKTMKRTKKAIPKHEMIHHPDFTKAQRVVNTIRKANAGDDLGMQQFLDNEIARYSRGPKSYSNQVGQQQAYGSVGKFDKAASHIDQAKTVVQREIHNAYNKSVNANAELFQVEDVANTNKIFSAYKTIDELITERTILGREGYIEPGGILSNIIKLPSRMVGRFGGSIGRAGEYVDSLGRKISTPILTHLDKVGIDPSKLADADLSALMKSLSYGAVIGQEYGSGIDEAHANSYDDYLELSGAKKKMIEPTSTPEAIDLTSDNFISAVIKQESGGDPTAVSSKGAKGIMQIMPKTWDWIGEEILGVNPKDYNVENPEHNMMFGKAYLGWLGDYWDRKEAPKSLIPRLTLASYNAGQGRIGGIVEDTGYNWSKIFDKLPSETQGYVHNIMKDLG